MDRGGPVIELTKEEMEGKWLSECLQMVDARVEEKKDGVPGDIGNWEEGVENRIEWTRLELEKARGRKVKKDALGKRKRKEGGAIEVTDNLDDEDDV